MIKLEEIVGDHHQWMIANPDNPLKCQSMKSTTSEPNPDHHHLHPDHHQTCPSGNQWTMSKQCLKRTKRRKKRRKRKKIRLMMPTKISIPVSFLQQAQVSLIPQGQVLKNHHSEPKYLSLSLHFELGLFLSSGSILHPNSD